VALDDVQRPWKELAIGHAVRTWLFSMQCLLSLDLTWGSREATINVAPTFLSAWHTNFFTAVFPGLSCLKLRRMNLPPVVLSKFLHAHKTTLQYLHLSEGIMVLGEEGKNTHARMLTFVKDRPALKRLEYVTQPERSSRPWDDDKVPCCQSRGRIYDENWIPNHHSMPTSEKLLENYVVRQMPWPMVGPNPNAEGIWKHRKSPNGEFKAKLPTTCQGGLGGSSSSTTAQ
jgi:hypothetical protein